MTASGPGRATFQTLSTAPPVCMRSACAAVEATSGVGK
jgi:hypothetical protein